MQIRLILLLKHSFSQSKEYIYRFKFLKKNSTIKQPVFHIDTFLASFSEDPVVVLDNTLKLVGCNSVFAAQTGEPILRCKQKPIAHFFEQTQKLNLVDNQPFILTLKNGSKELIEFSSSPFLISTKETGYLWIGKLLRVRNNWDDSMQEILLGTYNQVGNDFFKSITKKLALELGMKYAFIGQVKDFDTPEPKVETLTFWNNKTFKNNFEYALSGSPCEKVVNHRQVYIRSHVAELYPKDKGLQKLKANSYIGTPIYNKAGKPLGLVVLMDTKPIHLSTKQAHKLHLFANRIGTELEWVKNDNRLFEQKEKLRSILQSIPNPVYVQTTEGVYENCNSAFLNYFNLKEKDILFKPLDQLPAVIKKNCIYSTKDESFNVAKKNYIERKIKVKNKYLDVIVTRSPIKGKNNTIIGNIGVIQDITQIKEAERKLYINEEKYRTLFNKANDAFLLMKDDKFVDCNPKALEIFGCSRENLIGKTPHLFSPLKQPDGQRSDKKALEKISKALSGKATVFNWLHKKFNGNLFDAEVSLNTFKLNDQVYVQAIVRDVSEKIKTTRDIEKQTLRMQRLYELTSDTQTPFNKKIDKILKMATSSLGMQLGGVSRIKGEAYELLNYYSTIPFSAEDINYLSETYCSITLKENKLIAVPHFSRSKYSDFEVFKLLQLESYIGVPYWVKGQRRGTILFTSFYHVAEFNSFDADFVQTIAQWIGASIEREEYEESLRHNKALLDTLLREMPIDFSVRDKQLKMLWQSNKSKEVWGDNEGKDIDFSDVNEASASKWKVIFKRVLAGETIRGENEVKIYGKPYHFYSIASPIKVKNNVEQAIIIHLDISQIKKAEKKLKSQNAKLKKLNAELDRFVYSASHDLRAPLASLLGLIDLSKREKTSPALNEYLTLMNKSIIKLDSFISDITDYSRNLRLATTHEKIDFKQLITESFDSLAYMSNEKIKLSISVKGKAAFYSDKDRVRLIINNLLSNSIRYRSHTRQPAIKVSIEQSKEQACITIADNGIGIEEKYQKKIFNMFYRANDQNTGSGLGLFIVKETTDKLKGKIQLISALDKGTTISITLPNQGKP